MKDFGFRKWMVFIILSATVALAYQLPVLRYTFYDQMLVALQIDDVQMGLLASVQGIFNTVAFPVGGFIANRFPMKNQIMFSQAILAVLCLAFGFTTNFYALLVINVLLGFFMNAALWSAYLSGLRGLGDESMQSKLFGWSEATRGLVQTIMGFIFLAIMAAVATPVLGYRMVMTVGSAALMVLFVISFIFLPKGEKKTATDEKANAVVKKKYTVKDVIKNKGVWITILIIFCAYFSVTVGNGYLTTYSTRVVGISESTASMMGVIRSYAIVLLGGFVGGIVLDKFTYKGKGFIIFFAVNAVIIAGVLMTNKIIPVCVGLTLLVAFVFQVMKSTYWSLMGQSGIPAGMTALATGFISLVAFVPDMFAPALCGYWIDAADAAGNIAVGFNKIFIMLIIVSCVGIIGSMILMKRTKSLESSGELAKLNADAAEKATTVTE